MNPPGVIGNDDGGADRVVAVHGCRGAEPEARIPGQECQEPGGVFCVYGSEQAVEPVRHRIVFAHCWLA